MEGNFKNEKTYTCLPLSGRFISEDGNKIYHIKKVGVLTSLHLDSFENQPFLLDNQDLYRFIWQHKLKFISPDGCIKKLFLNETAANNYLKLDSTHCVWSPQTGFWKSVNSDLLNNGNIANEVHPCYIPGFKDKGGAPLINGDFVYKRVLIKKI